MCTGRTALVRSVTAAAAASGSRLSVTGSMSANTGRARSNTQTFALATNAHADRAEREVQAGGAARHRAGVGRPEPPRERVLEGRDARAERQLAGAQDL